MAHSSVVAVVPAHDEGPRIEAVVQTAMRHVPVLVIDDGSADDTGDRARAWSGKMFPAQDVCAREGLLPGFVPVPNPG